MSSSLIIVTDGSHKEDIATAGVTIHHDDQNHIDVVLQTPGHPRDLNSHRAELSGHYAAITILEVLEQTITHNNLQPTGHVIIACDNEATLRLYDLAYIFEPYQPDFDLLSSIRRRILCSPFTLQGQWVEGHQDDKNEGLDKWALLNVKVNDLANTYRDILIKTHTPPFTDYVLYMDGLSVTHNRVKLTKIHRNSTYELLTHDTCIDYWIQHHRISPQTIPLIDWKITGIAHRELPGGKQRWITKHASENCGIGTTLVKWNIQTEATCSLCQLSDEYSQHVLHYPSEVQQQFRASQHGHLKQWMLSKHTHPDIISVVISSLNAWSSNLSIPVPQHVQANVLTAFIEQTTIGWYNFLLGLGTKTWIICQQSHYDHIGKRNTGKRWLIELLKKLMNTAWDRWNTRNTERWKPGNYRDQQAVEQLDIAIQEEFSTGLTPDFPARSTYLLQADIDQILHSPLNAKKSWLQLVEAARLYALPSPESVTLQEGAYAPERRNLRLWMESKWY